MWHQKYLGRKTDLQAENTEVEALGIRRETDPWVRCEQSPAVDPSVNTLVSGRLLIESPEDMLAPPRPPPALPEPKRSNCLSLEMAKYFKPQSLLLYVG